MNIALFFFFFRVSSRKTSCNNFCSLSLNNLNSKEKVSSPSIYHWNRVSRASKFGFRLGCGLFIYREIGIFLWISSRQITRPWRDCGFFPRIRGLFMSEISRDRVEKFHSLFIGSSFESWMAQKEKKNCRAWMLYENHKLNPWRIIKWLVDHEYWEYFFDNTRSKEFFLRSISLNKKLQFRISRNDLAHKLRIYNIPVKGTRFDLLFHLEKVFQATFSVAKHRSSLKRCMNIGKIEDERNGNSTS